MCTKIWSGEWYQVGILLSSFVPVTVEEESEGGKIDRKRGSIIFLEQNKEIEQTVPELRLIKEEEFSNKYEW